MKRALFAILLLSMTVPAVAQRTRAPEGPPNPFQGNPDAIAQGKDAYGRVCTACHGPEGGAGEIGPAIVLSGVSVTLRGERTDSQIVSTIRDGIAGTAMPAFKGKLSDDDILKIGAYIHALRGTALDAPLPGDPVRGEQIFWGKGQCGTCHMIFGRGNVIGPDLSNVAGTRKTPSIIDALTKPSHRLYGDAGVRVTVVPLMNYESVHVVPKRGVVIDGVMLNQDAHSIQMMGLDGKLHLLDRADLRSISIKFGSIMPSDYDKRLAPDELRDLLAFLTRQGQAAPPPSAANY